MDNSNQTPVTPQIPSPASAPIQNDLPISEIVTNLKSAPPPAASAASPLQEVTPSVPSVPVTPSVTPVSAVPSTPPPAVSETKSPLYEDPNQVKPPVA